MRRGSEVRGHCDASRETWLESIRRGMSCWWGAWCLSRRVGPAANGGFCFWGAGLARRLADGGYVATRRFVADDLSLDPLDDLEAQSVLAELTVRASPPHRYRERDAVPA